MCWQFFTVLICTKIKLTRHPNEVEVCMKENEVLRVSQSVKTSGRTDVTYF